MSPNEGEPVEGREIVDCSERWVFVAVVVVVVGGYSWAIQLVHDIAGNDRSSDVGNCVDNTEATNVVVVGVVDVTVFVEVVKVRLLFCSSCCCLSIDFGEILMQHDKN